MVLWLPDNINILFGVLPYSKFVFVIQQIELFPAVDLIKRNQYIKLAELWVFYVSKQILCSEYVLPLYIGVAIGFLVADHCVGFSAAGLAVGETGDFGLVEGFFD